MSKMSHKLLSAVMAIAFTLSLLTGCQSNTPAPTPDKSPVASAIPAESSTSATKPEDNAVANSSEMAEVEDVVEEGMVPIYGPTVKDGTYTVKVSSSSAMFKIEDCTLTVEGGKMSAKMTMGGTGYLYLFLGTGAEAAAAGEDSYIPFEEETEGVHTFTVPVEALDMGIPCTAFSKRKEKWYDRTILFRADSLPVEAFSEELFTTAASLDLADGDYTANVTLAGGSGKASVQSPAKLTVKDGTCTAEIVWSSSKYDFMLVDGQRYDALSNEDGSTFEIPVKAFDFKLAVQADTIAMSEPHLIDYTLTFDSASIQPAQ